MGNQTSKDVFELPAPVELSDVDGSLDELSKATEVYLPGSARYDECRARGTFVLDPTIHGKPAAIAAPKDANEVAAIVKFLQKNPHVRLCVACGRHTHHSVIQDALMVDMGAFMNKVTVDASTREVRVQGGATIGMVDAACAPHHIIVPQGRIGTTGCAGQMLSTGAHAYSERVHGLGIDHLTSAVVVVATGDIITCTNDDNDEHADLFWAVRGGQYGCGIICEMVFTALVAPNEGKFYSGQQVFLPTGLLGMPNRRQVMDAVVANMDATRPLEYGFDATLIGGGSSLLPCILSHFWFGDSLQEGEAYLKKEIVKPGVAVANSLGAHDYHTEIQKWGNGPEGKDAAPGAYYIRAFQPHVFNREMATRIGTALDEKLPKGLQPTILLSLMGGKGMESSNDPELRNASPPSTCYWVVLILQWMPEVVGGAEGKKFAKKWVCDLWDDLVGMDKKAIAGDTIGSDSSIPSAPAAPPPAAAGSAESKTWDDVQHDPFEEQIAGVFAVNEAAGSNSLAQKKKDRANAIKSKYDPNGLFRVVK